MDRDILLKVFEAGSMPLTLEEIEMIMDEEMAKDPSEMDGDLVELCLDILTKATQGNEEKSEPEKNEAIKGKKRIKLKSIFIFAAVIAVLLAAAIPVCAKYIRNEASDDVVKYKANHFEIDLSAENNGAVNYSDESVDIIKALNEKGIENVILPAELLKEEYVKNIESVEKNNLYIAISINFENKNRGIKGNIVITEYKTAVSEFMIGQVNTSKNFDSVKQLSINGMEVLVFYDNRESYIIYVDNNTEYKIHILNCEFNSIVNIAETLE